MASSTRTRTDTPPVTPTAAPRCAGDCDGDRRVIIDELVRGINIGLGNITLDQCASCDANGDGGVTSTC